MKALTAALTASSFPPKFFLPSAHLSPSASNPKPPPRHGGADHPFAVFDSSTFSSPVPLQEPNLGKRTTTPRPVRRGGTTIRGRNLRRYWMTTMKRGQQSREVTGLP
ncbi:hypothetical protein OPV22_023320 [Ensete ventricosum]|uniref:Uncharacterized protein n=1 Tax=Ensete ventricosum TaxID=4639 RepID=A0AAV8QWN0_ENSVE|nr:hypothetical protein OPV22_023320 [Ensete ventricosum]